MTQKDWQREDAHTLGVFLNGDEIPERTPDGKDVVDDSFLLLFNAYGESIMFTLPTRRFGARWQVEIATAEAGPQGIVQARAQVTLEGRSLALLRRV
jgi:glycogen operon protein